MTKKRFCSCKAPATTTSAGPPEMCGGKLCPEEGRAFALPLLVAILIPLFFTCGWALDISGVKTLPDEHKDKGPAKVEVELSGIMVVSGIVIAPSVLRMPVTVSKAGRKYADVRLLSRKLYNSLIAFKPAAFKPKAVRAAKPSFKVLSARKLSSTYRVANVEVDFDADLAVTAGLLKKREGNYSVSWPGSFRIKDSAFRKEVEKAVVEAGLKELSSKK
ncbi:MAG: hypothetical protein ABIG11_07615 [bacterium]